MYVVDALQFYKLKLFTRNSKGVPRKDFKMQIYYWKNDKN